LVCAVFFLSFLLTFKQSMKDRVTAAIVIAWPNIGFVLITAHYFFEKDADLLLFFVSAIMVLLFFITPLQVLSRYLIGLKRGKKSHADAAK